MSANSREHGPQRASCAAERRLAFVAALAVKSRPLALALALSLSLSLSLSPTTAHADRLDDAFKQGNDAFLKGDYSGAISAYEHLDHEGVIAPDLAFNLGNAYFRRGQLGPAIWAWERGLTLDPDDEDARYNLEQARRAAARRVQDKIEGGDREPAWIRVVNLLPPATETWSFVVFYLAFFASMGLYLRARHRAQDAATGATTDDAAGDAHNNASATFGVLAGLFAIAALCTGALVFGRFVLGQTPFGIVLPDAVSVKEGADTNYRTLFDAHAGLRVRIQERDQDWVRVRLGNGLEGWLPSRVVGRL